jgi:hypothetical protein
MAAAFALRNQNGQTYGLCFVLSAVRDIMQVRDRNSLTPWQVLFAILWCSSWTLSSSRTARSLLRSS